MSIEGIELFSKEKHLSNCYQQLLRRFPRMCLTSFMWLKYYATFRGKNQVSERRSVMNTGSLTTLFPFGGGLCPKIIAPVAGAGMFFTHIL